MKRERILAKGYSRFGEINNAANKYIPTEIINVNKAIGHITMAIMELLIFLRILITNDFEN
jgi:hypothetical protein